MATGNVGYAAESRSELSFGNATGTSTMTEAGTSLPPVARPASRQRPRQPATVNASALARHLDCSRAYIGKLEAEGVIQRQGGGFPLDQSRVAYLQYLRRERRQSPRAEADADHVKLKTEMLQLRLMEKKRELVRRADVDELIDSIAGVTLTALSSLPARCAPRGDLAIRRSIERVMFEVRTEIATLCEQMADKNGEPPLDAC
jgi:phage terminase Nu1 subunit (DNA packaging protein)